MDTITINGREHELHYGLGFIREMDKRYQIDAKGFPLAAGLQSAVIYLNQGNPVVLEDIIVSATITNRVKPKTQEIEQWIEEQEDLDQVFTDFLTSLKTAPLTKVQTKKLLEAMEEAE